MLDWIFDVTLVLLGALIVAVFAAGGLAGLWLARLHILPRLGHVAHQNEVTGAVLHGILIIYGLAVALIAIAVWENYADVSKLASGEATAIASLYRDFSGYPDPTMNQLREGLKTYTEYVIREAWPLQQQGKVPSGGVQIIDRVQQDLFAFEPATDRQKIIHAETLHAYNNLIQARRLRLDAVDSGLPGAMWAVVLVGAVITLVSSFFFDVGSVRLHQIMVGLLADLMGLLIFLIVAYDYPFRGTHGVTAGSYELVYDHLMQH